MTAEPNRTNWPGKSDVVAAFGLIKDLLVPVPRYYWRELILAGGLGWVGFLLAAGIEGPLILRAALVGLAAVLWFRVLTLIHELTHLSRDELPGFHRAWNLVIGVMWLLPSIMYEGAHAHHHHHRTYGTPNDPEYIPRKTGAVVQYLAFALVTFPLLAVRFLLVAPLSWIVPSLRRWLIRYGSTYAINLTYARSMSREEMRRLFLWECTILLAWIPALVLTAAGVLPCRWLVCWYCLHALVVFVNRLRMLVAHRFTSDGSATDHLGQFRDSIDTPGGWWTELWAPLGLRYHALHHLYPTIPFHNLHAAYVRLVANLPADSFFHDATGRGFFPSLTTLYRARKRPAGGHSLALDSGMVKEKGSQ